MSYSKLHSISFIEDVWCLHLQPLYSKGILTSLSNGYVHLLDYSTGKSIQDICAHDSSINSLKIINNDYDSSNLFVTSSAGSVKIFDIRSNECVTSLGNKNESFISLDSRHDMLACGTELVGVDAKIYLYDIRKWDHPIRSFIDSHHDDITDIKFHPSDSNVLMSGSTDGYVNIYDLTNADEDDSLHQVINFTSIHSCGWISPRRIWSLSHVETFAIHELNDKSEELKEAPPLQFGDVRNLWDCDYVIDIYPGFIATGKTREGSGELKILPFTGEEVKLNNSLTIPNAHGDDVVRDVFIHQHNSELLYSCGEDGHVNIWRSKTARLNVLPQFWDYSKKLNVLENDSTELGTSINKFSLDKPSQLNDSLTQEQSEERAGKPSKSKRSNIRRNNRYRPY